MLTPDNVLKSAEFDKAAAEIAAVGRFLAERGWSPATSSNYSAKLSDDLIALTRTGIDKYAISASDVMVVDTDGEVVAPQGTRSSAETLIHTTIYAQHPQTKAVLHTHSTRGTRLSLKFQDKGEIRFQGYEMQKGLSGNISHEGQVRVPILPNAQDMKAFSQDVLKLLQREPHIHGFLIAGHGLYTWGADVKEARRHVETFEFLFECLTFELAGI